MFQALLQETDGPVGLVLGQKMVAAQLQQREGYLGPITVLLGQGQVPRQVILDATGPCRIRQLQPGQAGRQAAAAQRRLILGTGHQLLAGRRKELSAFLEAATKAEKEVQALSRAAQGRLFFLPGSPGPGRADIGQIPFDLVQRRDLPAPLQIRFPLSRHRQVVLAVPLAYRIGLAGSL